MMMMQEPNMPNTNQYIKSLLKELTNTLKQQHTLPDTSTLQLMRNAQSYLATLSDPTSEATTVEFALSPSKLKHELLTQITELYHNQRQKNYQFEKNKMYGNQVLQSVGEEDADKKIDEMSLSMSSLKRHMTGLCEAFKNNWNPLKFSQKEPEYLKVKEKLERFKMREEELERLIQLRVKASVQDIVEASEIIGEDEAYVMVKLSEDFIQRYSNRAKNNSRYNFKRSISSLGSPKKNLMGSGVSNGVNNAMSNGHQASSPTLQQQAKAKFIKRIPALDLVDSVELDLKEGNMISPIQKLLLSPRLNRGNKIGFQEGLNEIAKQKISPRECFKERILQDGIRESQISDINPTGKNGEMKDSGSFLGESGCLRESSGGWLRDSSGGRLRESSDGWLRESSGGWLRESGMVRANALLSDESKSFQETISHINFYRQKRKQISNDQIWEQLENL